MLRNSKYTYLGISLFSAMVLGAMSTQTVKADTTSSTVTNTSTVSATSAQTQPTSTSQSTTVTSPVVSTIGSSTGTTGTTTSGATTQPTSGTTTGTSTSGTTTQSTSGTTTGTTTSGTTTQPTSGTTTGTSTSGATTQPTSGTTTGTTTSGTTTQPTSGTTTGTSTSGTTTQPTSGTTAGTTTSGTTTQPTSSTGTSTSTTGTTVTQPATTPQTSTVTSTVTVNPYAIPSNVTDDTVVNFTDPLLENMVKYGLGVPTTQNLTVGDIKTFTGSDLDLHQTVYQLNHPTTATKPTSMTDQQDTPIESFNGMQYLQLLPTKTTIALQADLAADPTANEDLTPLDNLNFQSIAIDGNYSDPKDQEINVNQISDLNLSNANYVEMTGDTKDSVNSGLNDTELKEIAPTLDKFANNGQSSHMIELGQAQITDFTPLQGTETGNSVMIVSAPDVVGDATPIYAVDNQPISFTAPKILGLTGTDISNTYHFTYNVPQTQLADDDLTNLGNDNYVLNSPAQGSPQLVYGHIGWAYSANPDAYVTEKAGNATFDTLINIIQPLIWQQHPTVTINYVDATGKPIVVNGANLSKAIYGTTIGSPYDLTSDSQVAGYTLTSPASILKGTYTQDPQVVNLVYAPIPVENDDTTPVTQPVQTVTPNMSEAVAVQDVNGNTTEDAYLTDIGVKATATINGQLFYQVGYGQYVRASDYNAVTSTTPGEVRTFGTQENLVDAQGDPIDAKLSPNTAWKYDKIVSINGKGYYQVATDEYLPVSSGVDFTPTATRSSISLTTGGALYNSQGESLGSALPAGSKWATDGIAIINGVKMYRVATNEFVSADNATATEPVQREYHASQEVLLYNQSGQLIATTLPADTDWKVDQIFYINGQAYYRVATNEYVKVA